MHLLIRFGSTAVRLTYLCINALLYIKFSKTFQKQGKLPQVYSKKTAIQLRLNSGVTSEIFCLSVAIPVSPD